MQGVGRTSENWFWSVRVVCPHVTHVRLSRPLLTRTPGWPHAPAALVSQAAPGVHRRHCPVSCRPLCVLWHLRRVSLVTAIFSTIKTKPSPDCQPALNFSHVGADPQGCVPPGCGCPSFTGRVPTGCLLCAGLCSGLLGMAAKKGVQWEGRRDT